VSELIIRQRVSLSLLINRHRLEQSLTFREVSPGSSIDALKLISFLTAVEMRETSLKRAAIRVSLRQRLLNCSRRARCFVVRQEL
jgi:hypothetical protein